MTSLLNLLLPAAMAMGTVMPAQAVDEQKIHRSEEHAFRVETVAEGFDHPWALTFLPDGRMLVNERKGQLNLVEPDSGERTRITGLPEITARGQGGLLDVALHPRFSENNSVYLSYVAKGEGGFGTHVGRGRLQGTQLTDFEVLFRATPFTDTGQHFGSRLVFDGKGHLYISLGERNQRDRAQDLQDHNGSLIRLTEDGEIPQDNPFVGRKDALPAIYSYGHRNIQGMTQHPETGEIWLHEHGPRGGDEINVPQAGRNYGWPIITYGKEYYGPSIGPAKKEGLEPPIHHWTPSIAPSGMTFYTGAAFPRWQGDLFVGALAQTHLARLRFDGKKLVTEERLLDDEGWRIRDVAQGPDGLLYLVIDSDDAPIVRLRPVK
jgi:glucose/arabinose dehydrogenase